jgi:hypothetical protein
VKAEDIKHKDRLTPEQIGAIPLEQVYEWVRTGAWKQRDFLRWCWAVQLTDKEH